MTFPVIPAGTSVKDVLALRVTDAVDCRMLVSHVLGLTHAQLITQGDRALSEDEAKTVTDLLKRRAAGEPVAYLTGKRAFYEHTFTVTPDVLIPREETEVLVELAIGTLPAGGSFADLGTGSGIIAVCVAHARPDVTVTASDVSGKALEVAAGNANDILGDKEKIRFLLGSWFEPFAKDDKFDVIASNPPYIASGDGHLEKGDLPFEPQHALTDFKDGLLHLYTLIEEARFFLKDNGVLMMEHGYDQGKALREKFVSAGYGDVRTVTDLAGLDRVTLGRFKAAKA